MTHVNPIRVLGSMPEGQELLRGQVFDAPPERWNLLPKDIPLAAVSGGGALVAPTVTNNGDGTLTLSAGYYVLSPSETEGPPNVFLVPGGTYSFTDQAINYLYVSYNSGSPVIVNSTDRAPINYITAAPIVTLYRNGTSLSVLNFNSEALHKASRLSEKAVRCYRFEVEIGGLSLGESSGRVVIVSAGAVWVSSIHFYLDSFTSGDMTFYYHSAGNWTTSTISQYNNSQYDDGTALQTLLPNRYAVNWVYREVTSGTSRTFIVLGNGNYTLTEAQVSSPPTPPPELAAISVLVGRIIVKKGDTTATEIDSAFTKTFASTAATQAIDVIFTPFGAISATNVQAAIEELDSEKAATSGTLAQFSATTSSQLAGVISDETGGGALVFAESPTLITPNLGTPASGTLTNCTGLPVTGIADGTAGQLITWDSDGNAAVVAVGTSGYVLTSNGAGAAPTFQAGGSGSIPSYIFAFAAAQG